MFEKNPYGHKYIPGSIERTQQDWAAFELEHRGRERLAESVSFVPALGGCFIVVSTGHLSSIRGLSSPQGSQLVEEFWDWLQERHPIVPQGHSIMVVDDDQSILKLLEIILENAGFGVSSFGDGRAALAAMRSGTPDVLMVDLRMPGMDGRQFFHEVRAREIDSKVIIVSAFMANSAARELGADGALAKPFAPDELIDIVRRLTAA